MLAIKALQIWQAQSQIKSGYVFRALNKKHHVKANPISEAEFDFLSKKEEGGEVTAHTDFFTYVKDLASMLPEALYQRSLLSELPDASKIPDPKFVFALKPLIFNAAASISGLLNSMMGRTLSESTPDRMKSLNDAGEDFAFSKLISLMKIHEKKLKDFSSFFVYEFSLEYAVYQSDGNSKSGHDFGHSFLVIQYLDADKTIKYRLLQSYVDKYSLNEYLGSQEANQQHIYKQDEFFDVLKNLERFCHSKIWDQTAKKLHSEVFNLDLPYENYSVCYEMDFVFPEKMPKQNDNVKALEDDEYTVKFLPDGKPPQVQVRWSEFSVEEVLDNERKISHDLKNIPLPRLILLSEEFSSETDIKIERLLKDGHKKFRDSTDQDPNSSKMICLYHDPFSGKFVPLILRDIDVDFIHQLLESEQERASTGVNFA